MLFLSRKIGESIVINNAITLTVIEVRGKSVKLGFNYPPDATVLRQEVHERISAENTAASKAEHDLGEFDLTLDMEMPHEPD